MTIFVRNGRRFNIHAPQEIDGVLYPSFVDPELRAALGILEVDVPERESEETHFVQELDEAPFVINTPKPADMVFQSKTSKVQAQRAAAYREEADPLFFKAQRGDATMDDWLAKVAEIKARFPDPLPE
ncbi:hypothetical protein OTERR_13210 [Oryzomicrobium terrae]|uniref:Uncharacterized protein n=1 Tax=Oryzomicrobium terrae TaxID=1735038 RepID=A0A5C1E9G6_9RHOO|nr:hypothetical protein [Oryzomicrobium terrae]QEL64797.1 hypothetical protein OTERR_13210 [Oryzomicrobium terrae]